MSTTRQPTYDDRYSAPVEASRRGAHRARPKPIAAGLPVLAGIAVILVVIGSSYFLLRGNDTSSDRVAAAPAPSPAASPGAVAPAPSQDAGQPADTQTEPADPPTDQAPVTDPPDEDAAPAPDDAAAVDRSIPLKVLNSLNVSGLAKRVADKLGKSGWDVDKTDNSINRNLEQTKIYYGKDSHEASANALQQDLGFGIVTKDADVGTDGLTVVLGRDAT